MHYYGETYKHLYLPGSSYISESIQQCTPQSDVCSTTCHPVSVIKSPMPRWQSYAQPFTYIYPQPSVTQASLLSCQPYVQQCVLSYPEPCETTCLLPCRKPSLKLSTMQSFQPCETGRPEKKRTAKSLPPCAPRCPEPGKLKFPPCGIKYSSSCKDECRSQKISKCSSQQYGAELRSQQGMTSGYSPPLQGVTECPPQQCISQSFLQEYVEGFPHQKCMKGYPTQECITTYSSQQCGTKCPPGQRIKECSSQQYGTKCPPGQGIKECSSQQCGTKCPPGQGIKACSSQQHIAKCSLLQEGAKHKSSSTQHLSKSKCLFPRATQHSAQHHAGGAKHSSHSKKTRCAPKWLW